MEFRYTDEQLALRARAAGLAYDIMAYEEECERHRGPSRPPRGPDLGGHLGLLQFGTVVPAEATAHA